MMTKIIGTIMQTREKYLPAMAVTATTLKCYPNLPIPQWTIFGKCAPAHFFPKIKHKENKMMNIDNTAQADDLIYVDDVINMFGGKASRNVVYAWIREKKLPAMKVGRRFVFSRKRVQAYMTKQLGIAS